MKKLQRGVLITFEGIDGSGKTTLLQNVAAYLRSREYPVVVTQEPGGSFLGAHIRALLHDPQLHIDPQAEFLLFAADRAQHLRDVIIPALEEHSIILSDRMADSSLAYQGFGRGLDKDFIQLVNTWVMGSTKPDLTFYTVIDPHKACERIEQRGEKKTSFELEKITFFQKVSEGYETIFKNADHVKRINGAGSLTHVTEESLNALEQFLITLR